MAAAARRDHRPAGGSMGAAPSGRGRRGWPLAWIGSRGLYRFVQSPLRDRRASLGLRLLSDLRIIFGNADAMHTETIIERLINGTGLEDDAPWGDLHGKLLAKRGLASMLAKYNVRPLKVTVGRAPSPPRIPPRAPLGCVGTLPSPLPSPRPHGRNFRNSRGVVIGETVTCRFLDKFREFRMGAGLFGIAFQQLCRTRLQIIRDWVHEFRQFR